MKKIKKGNYISVLAVYFAAQVIFIMSPAMQSFSTNLYPDIPYSSVLLLSTISSLLMIPGSLLAGAVLGKRISFRHMALISIGGIVVAGVLPYFIDNFTVVLFLRVVVGFCIGLGFPLQSTLVLKLFNDKERPDVLGKATFVMAVGSIFYMLMSGILSDINAAYVWLVHGVLIIPLVLVFVFLKEPEKSAAQEDETEKSEEKLPKKVIYTSILFMIIFFAFYPVLLNMSAIIDYENMGTAATAGIISSIFTIGNGIAGLIFAKVYKMAGRYIVPFGLTLWVVGMAIFSLGHNLTMIVCGVLICGIAVQIVWPGTINSFSEYVPSGKMSMASALFISGMNLGCFLTSFFISGVAAITGNSDPRVPCMIGLVIVVVFSVIWSLTEIISNRTNKE